MHTHVVTVVDKQHVICMNSICIIYELYIMIEYIIMTSIIYIYMNKQIIRYV